MATLASLRAWRDRLFQARVSGAREVQDQNGQRLTYKGDSEMAAALAAVDRAIADAEAGRPTPNTIRFTTSKGL